MAFLALIYGMYLKISTTSNSFKKLPEHYSVKLLKNEKIKNIEVIDSKSILILIDRGEDVRGLVYDIEKNNIIRLIDK